MSEPSTIRDIANLLQGWLKEVVQQELAQRGEGPPDKEESFAVMLTPQDAEAKQLRTRRFREALVGIEIDLLDQPDLNYRAVLNVVTHNIGASLQALGVLEPAEGIASPVTLDFRRHQSFPALVALHRYVALPRTTRAMHRINIDQHWPAGATLFLAEYRQWQPRLIRGPSHDEFHFGLFAWNLRNDRDLCFMPVATAPTPNGPAAAKWR